LTLAQTTLKVN